MAPILLSKKEVAALLNISVGMVEKLVQMGVLEPVRIAGESCSAATRSKNLP